MDAGLPDPTAAARWRRVAVRPVVEAYAAHAGVDAVMVSGSTARGDADRWSDVEVGVFWSRQPTIADRMAIARVAGAADVRVVTGEDAGAPWYDHVYLGATRPGGLMLEVVHTQTGLVDEALERVLGSGRPDGPTLDAIKGIVDGQYVAGPQADVVGRWQERARVYPRRLAVAVVERDGRVEQFWRWRMLVERENPLLVAREFVRIASQALNVLHALNGRYCGHVSAFKRLDGMERELTIAPRSLATRLRAVFDSPVADGAEVLRGLVEETYDLVEIHLPEVNVDELRSLFRSERQPLDSLPGSSESALPR